jgi:hypothetical protein
MFQKMHVDSDDIPAYAGLLIAEEQHEEQQENEHDIPAYEGAMVAHKPRGLRRLAVGAVVLGAAPLGLAWAINNVDGVGPWLADTGRTVIGPENIASSEDAYYTATDAFNRWRYRDAPPAELFEERIALAEPAAPPAAALPEASAAPRFPPPDIVPPIPRANTSQDGHWTTWATGPEAGTDVLARTQLHPDKERTQAVAALIAIDLTRVTVHLVAGTREPFTEDVPVGKRAGTIPAVDLSTLIAAFNGGWQSIHGHYGMRVGQVVVAPDRDAACKIALQQDGSLRITDSAALKDEEPTLQWSRQTPPCLLNDGVAAKQLSNIDSVRWGSAIGGNTIVRRSAVGIDAAGEVLYYAAGDSLSAQTLTLALTAAGASSAAMLDINWSYPKFVTYGPAAPQPDAPPPVATDSLFKHPLPAPSLYTQTPATRDFFYLTLNAPSAPPSAQVTL